MLRFGPEKNEEKIEKPFFSTTKRSAPLYVHDKIHTAAAEAAALAAAPAADPWIHGSIFLS